MACQPDPPYVTIPPASWEAFHGMRELTLAYFPPADAASLRRLGTYFLNVAVYQTARGRYEVRRMLRSAVADLRTVQGFLSDRAVLGHEPGLDDALRLAPELALEVRESADRLEGVLP
jgi:hypothetical protein